MNVGLSGSGRLSVPTIQPDASVIDHAIALATTGFLPIPLHKPLPDGTCTCRRTDCTWSEEDGGSQGKHPVERSWQKNQLRDAQSVRDAFQRLSFVPNLGIVLGEQQNGEYVLAVDFDDDDRALKLLDEYGELPPTATSRSKRGNRMLFVIPPDVPRDRLKNITGLGGAPGVDVKVKGGQIVVPPSIHPSGVSYSWVVPGTLADLPPAWALAILAKPERPEWIVDYTPQRLRDDKRASKRAEKYLEAAVLDEARLLSGVAKGGRNNALYTALCRLLPVAQGTGLATGHGYVVRELSSAARATGLSEPEVRTSVSSAEKWLQESGAVRMPHEVMGGHAPPGGHVSSSAPEPEPDDSPIQLIMDSGAPAKCATNVQRLLQQHDYWRGGPRLDLFGMRIHWPEPLPEVLARANRTRMGLVVEDAVHVQGWLLSQSFASKVKVGLDIVKAAILAAARDNSHDSLTDYVNGLPEWDGIPRLDKWLVTYLGAEDTRTNKWIGRSWLTACIARAIQPGCVGDAMLVMEGLEAVGKNRFVDVLFGGRPWVGTLGTYRIGKDREADRIAGACWVLHMDELTGLSHASKEAIKSWLTRPEDAYRIPYEAGITYAPRRCVAIGSTNEHEYLEDDQNRRFWPVRCGVGKDARFTFDWEGIERDRLQLLSEARVNFKAGVGWTIGRQHEAWDELVQKQGERVLQDPISEAVDDRIRQADGETQKNPKFTVTMNWIMDGLGVQPKDRDSKLERRIARAMRLLGWDRVVVWDGGKTCRSWVRKPTSK
jgi:Virulence-associated protein E/Bifunctional DNA primase/polymerase, N-terminal